MSVTHAEDIKENTVTAPRKYSACLWGVIALFSLYYGVFHGSAAAWWLVAALVPPLIVFVWWMVDRSALESRIKRLEARSEIADQRRVDTQADLTDVVHNLNEMHARVTGIESMEKPAGEIESKSP